MGKDFVPVKVPNYVDLVENVCVVKMMFQCDGIVEVATFCEVDMVQVKVSENYRERVEEKKYGNNMVQELKICKGSSLKVNRLVILKFHI